MRFNEQTFAQLMELDTQSMAELVNTVSLAAVHKPESVAGKALFSSLLMDRAIEILESIGCEITIRIDHNDWEQSVRHGNVKSNT